MRSSCSGVLTLVVALIESTDSAFELEAEDLPRQRFGSEVSEPVAGVMARASHCRRRHSGRCIRALGSGGTCSCSRQRREREYTPMGC